MRLCVFGANTEMGGTESYLLNLYSAIDKEAIQFDFLMRHNAGQIPYENTVVENGGRILREYYRNSERGRGDFIGVKELFDRHPEWDGVYINLQRIHTAYRLLEEAYRRKLPYRIIHAHNNRYAVKRKPKDRLYEVYFLLTKRFVVTDYLACSKSAGEWLFKKSQFTVIPNAIDFDKFQMNESTRENMRNRYQIGNDTKVIGFCGRLVYQKNPEFLAKIFKAIQDRLPDSVLLIVGDGEKNADLTKWLDSEGLLKKTIITGNVSNVYEYMQMMDCFVLPSRFEGFGIVLLEAQAAGLRCFTRSGAVPSETNVSGRVKFIDAYPPQRGYDARFDIKDDAYARQWANVIVDTGFDRKNVMDALKGSMYTLDKMKERFEKIFL